MTEIFIAIPCLRRGCGGQLEYLTDYYYGSLGAGACYEVYRCPTCRVTRYIALTD